MTMATSTEKGSRIWLLHTNSNGHGLVKCTDFVVFTFKGMIIVRVPFDKIYFELLVQKLNWVYKRYMLPKLK